MSGITGFIIRNGTIINADGRRNADIRVHDGRIVDIGPHLPPIKDEVTYDARGMLVFPGGVEPHSHIYLRFMGTTSCDTYASATKAALCGGTTTLFDFVIPNVGEDPETAIAIYQEQSQGAAHDFGWHLAVVEYNDRVAAQVRDVTRRLGIRSIKVFLAYLNALGLDDEGLYSTLVLAKDLDLLTLAHCENAVTIARRQRELIAAGKTGPEWHYYSRPPMVEADGTFHFCDFLCQTGARGYIVHLSCREALEQALMAQRMGAKVLIETLIQYLLLHKGHAELPEFKGAEFVMSPPLRDAVNQDILWHALRAGQIATVGTDHAPFTRKQKQMGKDAFDLIPNGIPSLEDRVRLLYTYGVLTGRLSHERFVELVSTAPAQIFELYPRKGRIALGSDADIVVYDPSVTETLSAKTHHSAVDYNAFEGTKVRGRCALVFMRGHLQVRDGQFVGTEGIGRYLARPYV